MKTNAKNCALYFRVSTSAKKKADPNETEQTTENQKPEVEQLAQARGFEITAVYEEAISAAKHRPAYERMLADARKGRFGVLCIWALDRFGRTMVGNIQDLLELDRLGVTVISVREPWLDTGGPVRALLIAIFSWCAEQERNRLIERTMAGLETARRKGKRFGRPPSAVTADDATTLRAQGLSVREIAIKLGCGPATVSRRLALSKTPSQGGR